jgi:hypothetical protein
MTLDDPTAKYPRLLPNSFVFPCEPGWYDILGAYFAVVDHLLPTYATYRLRQVKEKLGSLRIYSRTSDLPLELDRQLYAAKELAEARSYYVCEYCGSPGCLRKRRGYFTVACEEHAERDGRMAVPVDLSPRIHIGSAMSGWRVYDPDLDAFVECDEPTWDD